MNTANYLQSVTVVHNTVLPYYLKHFKIVFSQVTDVLENEMTQRWNVAEPVRCQVLEEIPRAHILVLQLDFFQLTEGHMRCRKVVLWGFWAPILNKTRPILNMIAVRELLSPGQVPMFDGARLWTQQSSQVTNTHREKGSREHLLSFETTGSDPWMIFDLSHFFARWNELEEGSAQTEKVNRTSRDCRIIQPELCLQVPFLTSLSSFWGCWSTRGFKTHVCFSHLIINLINWCYRDK